MPSLRKTLAVLSALSVISFAFYYAGSAASASPPPQAEKAIPEHTLFIAEETDTPLRLKPRKPIVVRLDKEVSKVTVDDKPAHVTAVVYDRTSIALIPKGAGAAHITVYGKNGDPIMARYVIIADPAEKYIRLRQTCRKGGGISCERERVYYCPNLCYETRLVEATAPE